MNRTTIGGRDVAATSPSGGERKPSTRTKLLLVNGYSPGDVLMLTAAVRDLHRAYPGEYLTAVQTACPALWENNPFVCPDLDRYPGAVTRIDCGQPPLLSRQSSSVFGAPRHYVESMHELLSARIGRPVPLTRVAPQLHLTPLERAAPPLGLAPGYWVVVGGGKTDLTTKWWPPARYQRVVDHFRGRLRFVQAGAACDHHPRLAGCESVVGSTSLRQFVCLLAHADGVVCPVTCAVHLAAAFDKPCVVVAGGREPVAWEMYPTHQFLHTVGQLACCRSGGCWKARVVPLGDGDPDRDRNLCRMPADEDRQPVARCMSLIEATDVIRAVERYLNAKEF